MKGYDKETGEFNNAGILYFNLDFMRQDMENELSEYESDYAEEDYRTSMIFRWREMFQAFEAGFNVQPQDLDDEPVLLHLVRTLVDFSATPPRADILAADTEYLELFTRWLEEQAYVEVGELLNTPDRVWPICVQNEGHSGDSLVCKISVTSHEHLRMLYDKITGLYAEGDDQHALPNTPYYCISRVTLYPDLGFTNGQRFSHFGYAEDDGTIEEWLEDNNPAAKP